MANPKVLAVASVRRPSNDLGLIANGLRQAHTGSLKRLVYVVAVVFLVFMTLGAQAMDPETRQKREEASMMKALHNCPLCRDKEPCLLDCRFAQKRSWKECLEECLKDSPMVRDLMISMSDASSKNHQDAVTP